MTKKDEAKKSETRGRKKGVKSNKIPKCEILANKRKYFKGEKRRLSPKEKGIAISRGKKAAARKNKDQWN